MNILFLVQIDEDSEQDIYIDEIYNHENFDGNIKLNNDISVIKLKTSGIKFNQYVQPICLPTKNDKLIPNMNCTITGWGSDGSIGSSTCFIKYQYNFIIYLLMIKTKIFY